jgi:acyl-CoA synthetase (AMP-forming)/AMP-acid ligase II
MTPTPGEASSRLDYIEVSTIGDLLVRGAAKWPDKELMVFYPDDRRTYMEMLSAAERSARSLLGLGIHPGDRVGILMPNCFDFVETQLACALLGVSSILVNARYKLVELTHVLHDSDAVAMVTSDLSSEYVDLPELLAGAAAERPASLRHLVLLGDFPREGYVDRHTFEAAAEDVPLEDVHAARERVRLRDEAVLMYTSGTTAHPKGCVLSHEALVRAAMAAAERWRLGYDDRFWNALPMFHMSQLFPLISHMYVGGTILTTTRFDPVEGLEMMERERCTFAFPTFPTITQSLIHHPKWDSTDLSSVRLVNDTGPPDTLRQVQEKFGSAPVVTLFGMTETCGGVSWGAPDDPYEKRMTTGGLPLRGYEVRIVDPATDEPLPAGERGEITVRSPGLFDRYLNDPEKTAQAMRGGWFHTGDLGRVDEDGRLSFLGRLKDMLKVGGENVAALEIEAYLGTHPAVKIAQVVGVPDPKYDEVPAAFVELADGAEATAEELQEYCRGQIASFKIPRYVRFVTEWPMSASKIQKFRLREQLVSELSSDTSG